MAKYILFDLDGTLTDPYEGIIKSFQHAFSHFGITEEDTDKLRKLIGPPLRDTFAEYGVELEKAVALYRERFGTLGLYENALYDGIAELLEYLKVKGFILAIASSKPEVYVKKIAEHFNIARYFAFMGGSELDGRRSDKAEVIQYVTSVLGVLPDEEVYMVGDREHDILGAKKCGILSIGVLYGYGIRAEIENAGVNYIASDTNELKALFAGIMAARTKFSAIETYMQSCMTDSAHDREHIYRVLNYALNIAKHEDGVNIDVLTTACLLHDIGRAEQFSNPAADHAECGAEKAYLWLTVNGYTEEFAEAVKSCIQTHRFRSDNPPRSIEAKILFDADKLDVCGAMGIARTLLYKAHVSEPLYLLDDSGEVLDGANDNEPSFFKEYKFKLVKIYDNFYTKRGAELAAKRKAAAENFYMSLLAEVRECYII